MAIKIEWQPLPPASKSEEATFFPRLKGNGTTDLESLCKLAVKHHTVFSRGELAAAFETIQTEMSQQLAQGKSIHIPGFGTFRLAIESNGPVPSSRRNRKDAVKLKTVIFQPDEEFLQSMGELDFRWSSTALRSEACDKSHLKSLVTDYLATHPSITCAELAELAHLGRSTANKHLKELLNDDFLVREGTGKNTRYTLTTTPKP